MTTIKDVAKHAGVSFKTVSRVMNGVQSVNSDLRRRVLVSIEELNYRPNQAARELRGVATTICFVYNNPNSNYIIEVQEGIIRESKKFDFGVSIHPAADIGNNTLMELRELGNQPQMAGFILTPPLSEDETLIQGLKTSGINLVRIVSGETLANSSVPTLHVDDSFAAYNLTKHLLDLGHNEIIFLAGDSNHNSTVERYKGFKQAHRDLGREPNPQNYIEGFYTFSSGVDRSSAVFRTRTSVSALVACNDEIAAGAMFAAHRRGMKVPEDISIVGFEDSPFSRQSWPNLTTARQSNGEMGSIAARLLVESLLEKNEDQSTQCPSIMIKPEIVIRDSTAPNG